MKIQINNMRVIYMQIRKQIIINDKQIDKKRMIGLEQKNKQKIRVEDCIRDNIPSQEKCQEYE